jgi:hypothetical protein
MAGLSKEIVLEGGGAVAVHALEAGAILVVETRNSRYRLVVVDGPKRRVIVEGGDEFLEAAPARLVGAIGAGCGLRVGCIVVGLSFLALHGQRLVRSSAVRSLSVEFASSPDQSCSRVA